MDCCNSCDSDQRQREKRKQLEISEGRAVVLDTSPAKDFSGKDSALTIPRWNCRSGSASQGDRPSDYVEVA